MIKNKIPDSILKRPKQAYRAPIRSTFISDNIPDYINEMLSLDKILESGIFNEKHVNQLMEKMKGKSLVSEIDNMALTGILSTQILNDLFVKRNVPELKDQDLIECQKIIINS
jgi:asparagine synthase (glutamine-hydrolysing)